MKRSAILVIFALSCGPGSYVKLIQKITPDMYPESNGVYIFDSTNITLNPDGSGRLIRHYLVKVLNPAGTREFSQVSFSYITLYDTILLKKAVVIKPDGKIVKVTEKDVEDIPMPAWEGSKFLIPNLRILRITFPEVEPGCAIECIAEKIMKSPPMDSTFDFWDVFEGAEPRRLQVLRVQFPPNLIPRWIVKNGIVEHDSILDKDRITHIWWKKNISPIAKEPAMPPLPDVATKLVISTVSSWRKVSSWYYRICHPKLVADSTIRSLVEELLKGATSRKDSITRLYRFVQRKIRYVETRLIGKKGGYEPAPINFTLKNRYGVCRDKAALLAGMLQTAGFDAYMVLTNPVFRVEKDIPAPSQFNHAIVALDENGEFTFFDPTAEWSVEYLTPVEDDQEILVCTPEGRDLEKTPKRSPSVNLSETEVTIKIDNDRSAKVKIAITARGVIDRGMRTFLKVFSEERLKQIITGAFKSKFPEAKVVSLLTSDPEDLTRPVTMTIVLTIPDFATKIGKEWHIGGTIGELRMRFGFSKSAFSLESRRYPVNLRIISTNRIRTIITFPRKLRISSLPKDLNLRTRDIEITINYRKKAYKIISEEIFQIKSERIPPERYQENKELIERYERKRRETIILEEK